jgi:hypothetical protein
MPALKYRMDFFCSIGASVSDSARRAFRRMSLLNMSMSVVSADVVS